MGTKDEGFNPFLLCEGINNDVPSDQFIKQLFGAAVQFRRAKKTMEPSILALLTEVSSKDVRNFVGDYYLDYKVYVAEKDFSAAASTPKSRKLKSAGIVSVLSLALSALALWLQF